MADGEPINECITGFDRASVLVGAAADAWNYRLLADITNNTLGTSSKRTVDVFPLEIIEGLAKAFKEEFNYTLDEALYLTLPNPFASKESVTQTDTPPANLTLLDEFEAGQALPLWSLVQPARSPDFIIAWDNAKDASPYLWNNGTNIYDSYVYATNRSVPFPIIPSVETIMNQELNTKPVFFGCEAHLTNTNDLRSPIIMYMANAPYSSYTNYTGFQNTFTPEQTGAILTNGFNYVTQGNGTWDAEWPECLGCAVIDRSLAKINMQRTEQCQKCMTEYCWNGVGDIKKPVPADLPLRLDPSYSFEKWNNSAPYLPIVN